MIHKISGIERQNILSYELEEQEFLENQLQSRNEEVV